MLSREIEGGHFIRIVKGEELMETIREFARERHIDAAVFSGIGALADVTLGVFNSERKGYDEKHFDGEYEMVSLNGNLSLVDGEPFVHAHCALGDRDYSLIGGHLMSGTIFVTGEIWLRVLPTRIEREMDEAIGIKLLDL